MASPLNIALLFTVIFAALKIAGVTSMSWLGVFTPMILWVALLGVLIIYYALKRPYRRSRYDRFW